MNWKILSVILILLIIGLSLFFYNLSINYDSIEILEQLHWKDGGIGEPEDYPMFQDKVILNEYKN